MSVYIVIAREYDDIRVCEAYAGATHALGRGFQLASDFAGPGRTDLWTASPDEVHEPDIVGRSSHWIFMDTNKHSVIVFYRPKIETSIPSSKESISMVAPLAAPIHQPSTTGFSGTTPSRPTYDFLDPSLPVGWTVDGKPALMSDLTADPLSVQDPSLLSEAQKWALVTVRISKSPAWKGIPKGSPIAWFHRDALTQLKSKSGIGELLRDGEIELLRAVRESLIEQL